MKKNICIVHFNTPVLTRCLVQSINRYTPGANIYIFDNSNKKPFINTFDNVTVLDNTKGQLVNFDEVLSKFPMRVKSRGKTNNYGSAKHSISIQKCAELIEDGFILLDSDVLLKRDISPLWNEKYVWIAGVEDWLNKTLVGATKRKRVCPFLLYMNTKKMKELGITFYDDTHMLGFNNGPKCEEYETGVWFYEATPKDKRKIINYTDYIVHFRAGSWLDDARTKQRYKQIEPKKWLLNNRRYWDDVNTVLPKNWYEKYESAEPVKVAKKENYKFFNHIYCLHYLPAEERLENMKNEFNRVGIDTSADYFSWVYDYPSPLLDTVYNDKRINMGTVLKSTSREYIKRVSMKHYEIIKEAYALGYERILITEDDIKFHINQGYIDEMFENMPDSDVVMFDKMTSSSVGEAIKYKKYLSMLPEGTLYGSMNDSGVFFIFCSCYSLNRKAMERIISLQENMFLPPDTPLNDKTLTGSFAITNLAIQDPKTKTRKVESYDRIGLDTTKYGCENAVEAAEHTIIRQPMKVKQVSNDTFKKKEPVKIAPSKTVNKTVRFKPVTPAKKDITFEVKKNNPVRTRTIQAKVTGHNKLYDVF